MTNNTPKKYYLQDHANTIQAFFKDASSIEILNGSCDRLNRYKHAGAQLLVDGTYYYFTTSQFNIANGLYVSLNKGLVNKLKDNKDHYKVVLINKNNFTIFDKWTVNETVSNANYKLEIPVVSVSNAEYIWPLRSIPSSLSFKELQPVSYGAYLKGNKHHAKSITISAPKYKYKRTFKSIIEAYATLTGTKIENSKIVGKPVSNAAYKKSYKQFQRDIKASKLYLINANGEAFLSNVAINVATSDRMSTSTILNNNIYNIVEMDISKQASNDQEIRNKDKRALNKQYEILADRLAEKCTSAYSKKEIFDRVESFGSNKHMLEAFVDALNEKGLIKEALYASSLWTLNNLTN